MAFNDKNFRCFSAARHRERDDARGQITSYFMSVRVYARKMECNQEFSSIIRDFQPLGGDFDLSNILLRNACKTPDWKKGLAGKLDRATNIISWSRAASWHLI